MEGDPINRDGRCVDQVSKAQENAEIIRTAGSARVEVRYKLETDIYRPYRSRTRNDFTARKPYRNEVKI